MEGGDVAGRSVFDCEEREGVEVGVAVRVVSSVVVCVVVIGPWSPSTSSATILDPEAFTSEESSNKRGVHEMGVFSTHSTAGEDLSAPKDSLTTITQDNNDNG
jgi:hypothetical protein